MKTKVLLVAIALISVMSFQAQTTVTLEKLTGVQLTPTAAGTLIWGDYNNDGLLDGFITAGQAGSATTIHNALYKNLGNGSFDKVSLSGFFDISRASAAWIDYNNDGNLDLVITGSMMAIPSVFVYRNGGAPDYQFVEETDIADVLPPVFSEKDDHGNQTICAFDYNNDGWTDLLVTGQNDDEWNGQGRVVALFKNTLGVFEYQATPVAGDQNFNGVNGGAAHVGDVNNDGYADILISGYFDGTFNDKAGNGATFLYVNDKNGGFTLASPQPAFTGHQEGTNFFADVNNDGWMDIIEIGRDLKNGWSGFANLFINNQGSGFTKSSPFGGGSCSGMSTGDVNNDGYIDFLLAGYATNCKIVYGKGDGTFLQQELPSNQQARGGYVNLVDLNGDNNLDVTVFGYSDGAGSFLNDWYIASGAPANQAPTAPATLDYADGILSWPAGSDDHTPTAAIRYNVAVRYADGSVYSYVPADINTGKVKVNNAAEPFLATTSFELNIQGNWNLIGVQAIDQTGLGSAFTTITPTGISEAASNNVNVLAGKQNISIIANEPAQYSVISLSGQTIASGLSATANIAVQSGVYLVKTLRGNAVKTQKVLVY
ncbi:MAG: T9SS type A sorting domain-containing protein [Candidatus Symbiothrix sp.]|jgi:hypothetical protein|nr:T9SS type A sorting domain-containing protein [Candidatus Symbiothrix sp.]